MTKYKVGTYIDFEKQARKRERLNDLGNSLFWAMAIVLFLYCLLG